MVNFRKHIGLGVGFNSGSFGVNSLSGNPPVNTVAPTTTGTPKTDEVLSGTDGIWTGDPTITYSYQWQESTDGVSFSNKSGETNSTYTVVYNDIGKYIRRNVYGDNGVGSPVLALSSNSLEIVAYVYNFNGTNAYMNFGNILNSTLAGAAQFTVMSIIKRKSLGTQQAIWGKWLSTGNLRSVQLRFETTNTINLMFSSNGTNVNSSISATTITNTTDFLQIFGIIDMVAKTIKVVVNGTLVVDATTSLGVIYTSTAPLLFGSTNNGTADYLDAYHAGSYVWNKCLTPSEYNGLYNGGDLVDPTTVAGGVFSTPFTNDTFSTNWTIVDSIAANNGTSANMVIGDRIEV